MLARQKGVISNDLRAFSLAEVLITLGIIGVVAAFTIPALMNVISDYDSKSALKKDYSVISQAYSRLLSDNGGSFVNLCPGDYTNSTCVKNLFSSYLALNKTCSNSAASGCWHQANQWLFLKPNTGCGAYGGIVDNCPNSTNFYPGNILNDGSFITFSNWDGNCDTFLSTNFKICGYLTVDVNGFKKPNTIGRDIFAFWMTPNLILPLGNNDIFQGYCSTTGSGEGAKGTGWGCTAKYLLEN